MKKVKKILIELIKYFYNFFLYIYIKTVNRYNQKNKGKIQNKARERYQNLSKEEKKGKKGLRQILKYFWRQKRKKATVYKAVGNGGYLGQNSKIF